MSPINLVCRESYTNNCTPNSFQNFAVNEPEEDDDAIEAPSIAAICIVLYAASYVLLGDTNSSASIRQFNTKVDSGLHGDIPAKVVSDFLLKRFENELQRIPMMEKGRV